MYRKKVFSTNLVCKAKKKSHEPNRSSQKERFEQVEMFVDLLSDPTTTVIKQPPRKVIVSRS